jgi:hypothetical protein
MLLAMKAVGAIDGAARWIGYGRFKFQASDLAKYALILHLATMIVDKKSHIKDLYRAYYPMITVVFGIVGLVALEPNFSTAAVIALICFVMLFLGGVDVKHLALTALAFVPVAAGFAIAAPYRVARLLTFVGEGSDKASYQIEQALIGLGNGGVFGLGPGASKQRELFLPASYNDFIFAVSGRRVWIHRRNAHHSAVCRRDTLRRVDCKKCDGRLRKISRLWRYDCDWRVCVHQCGGGVSSGPDNRVAHALRQLWRQCGTLQCVWSGFAD